MPRARHGRLTDDFIERLKPKPSRLSNEIKQRPLKELAADPRIMEREVARIRDVLRDKPRGGRPMNPAQPNPAPQNSNLVIAGKKRVYTPAARVKAREPLYAAAIAVGAVSFYGPVVEHGMLGSKNFSFDSYLRNPEVVESLVAQDTADAMMMRDRILQEEVCRGSDQISRRYLKRLCQALAGERQQPFRYFENISNSLWNPYVGVVKGRDANNRAMSGEIKRLEGQRAYEDRERLRMQARRSPKSRLNQLVQKIDRETIARDGIVIEAEKHAEAATRYRAKYMALLQKADDKTNRIAVLTAEVAALKKRV